MHKPQRKSSFGIRQSSAGSRESLRGVLRRSSGISSKSTPLLRNSTRKPLSSVKTNQRESYIGTSNQHAVKDPRPLTDKLYIKKCIFEVIQILDCLNFPNTITPKMFNPPSTKEYQRVFEFLTFEVMGNFRMIGKPEEEMLKALKDLGYPYNISKSTLSNVGAMSCWPNALGALMWLANLARYCHGLDDAIEETLQLNPRKKLKQEFQSRCYVEFMHGNDGPYSELISQLKDAVDDLDADALKTVEMLEQEHGKLLAEYDEKIQKKEARCRLIDEIEAKCGNIEKMRLYLSQCDEYVEAMKNKEREVNDTIKAREVEIEQADQELVKLKSQVAQQEMSRDDIEQVIREKNQLRESIQATEDRLEQLRSTKFDLDIQIGKLTLKADELASTFNNDFKTVANSLPLIKDHLPTELVENAKASDFTLALGHKGLENASLLSNKIQPFQSVLNTKMLEVAGSLESQFYNQRKRVKQDEEILDDLNKEKAQLQDQYQKLLKESEMLKEEQYKMEEVNNAKIKKAETSLEQIKSAQSESVDDLVAKLNESKERGKSIAAKHAKAEATKKAALKQLGQSVQEFQLTLHGRAEKAKETLKQIEEEGIRRLEEARSHTLTIKEGLGEIEEFLQKHRKE